MFYTQFPTAYEDTAMWAVYFSYLGHCDILLSKYDLCVYSLMVAMCILGSMLETASLRSGSWLGY